MIPLPSSTAADSVASVSVDPTFLGAISAFSLLIIALMLWWLFSRAVRYEPPRIESHWGGFGGTGGGWRISASLAYFVGALAFGAMFTALIKDLGRGRWEPRNAETKTREPPKPDSARSAKISPAGRPDSTASPAQTAPAARADSTAPPAAPK